MADTVEIYNKITYDIDHAPLDASIEKLEKIHELMLKISELSESLFSFRVQKMSVEGLSNFIGNPSRERRADYK